MEKFTQGPEGVVIGGGDCPGYRLLVREKEWALVGRFLNNTGRLVIGGWDRKKKGNRSRDPGHTLPQAAGRAARGQTLTCRFGFCVLGYELGALGRVPPPPVTQTH